MWRYSRIAELDLDAYSLAPAPEPVVPAALEALLGVIGPRSALVIGDHPVGPVAEGITVGPADEALTPGAVSGEPDAVVALNGAFASVSTVRVARGRVLADPIVALVWTDGDRAAHFSRMMVQVESGAEATVIEIVASPDVASLVVPVTEMEVADGARLRHVTLQLLGRRAWQVATQASRVGRDSDVVSYNVALGGDYARVRSDSTLAGPGGSSRQLAVFFGAGRQMLDFATVQSHQGKHTTSDLLYKGSVAEGSHSVYRGLIRVEKGASGTNAFQTNRNLVLGEGAHADSVPTLEIEENDVRCSHASAVGPIDEEQRFYLESRGVPTEMADRLIVSGFLDDVLERIPFPPLAPWLRGALAERIDAVRPE